MSLISLVALSVVVPFGRFVDTDRSPAGRESAPSHDITMKGSPLGVAWGFLYGYQGTPAVQYLHDSRRIGSGFTKVYLFWNQLEPQKGHYDWTASDAFAKQLSSPEEGLISIFSSSTWATRTAADQLPPSPAKKMEDYYRFIFDLVRRYRGRVRYWQNDSEPNNPLYWLGTKEEYVSELRTFYRAVKDADPSAQVVGGGYDGLFGPPGAHQFPNQQAGLNFFDYVLKEGGSAFDIFDMRLYGDPYTIEGRVQFMRDKMLKLGYEKPIIATEYGGPNPFELPVNRKYLSIVATWSQAVADPAHANYKHGQDQIEELYKGMSTLPAETQVFMQGCPPDLDQKYQRIQARGIVMRNIFAFSAGVQKTLYWQLLAAPGNRDDLMNFMYGKIGMLAYRPDGTVQKPTMAAEVFKRMSTMLAGTVRVEQIPTPERPEIFMFRVDRRKRHPLIVLWKRGDQFSGEDMPATQFEYPWTAKRAKATDAFGLELKAIVQSSRINLPISINPIYLEQG